MSSSQVPVPNPLNGVASERGAPPPAMPTSVQRTMGVLAWVMVIAGTLWVGLGHALMGGGGGWLVIFHLFFIMPVYGIVALTHAILVTLYGRRLPRFGAGPKASIAALVFTGLSLFYPLTVTDAGDAGPPLDARLTAWFGIPLDAVGVMQVATLGGLIVSALAMIVFDAIELGKLPRAVTPPNPSQ